MRVIKILLILVATSCHYSNHNSIETTDSTPSDVGSSKMVTPPAPVHTQTDSIIRISFAAGANEVTVQGNMRGIDKPVTVIIPAKKGQVLTATLLPSDSIANVRISHVVFANEKADGPFGRELTKKIPETGATKLIIAENLMQGEEWKGKFQLTVKLE